MKKLISYSLWGDKPKYCVGAVKNAQSAKEFYPDWQCIFFVAKDVPKETRESLLDAGAMVILRPDDPSNFSFNIHRFAAIDLDNVGHVIFRDTDSRFCQREVDAVNEWIKEDTALHIMKDHPYHGNFPILAGMFGLNKSKFAFSMRSAINEFTGRMGKTFDGHYYFDQLFLKAFVWHNFQGDCTIHDEFFVKKPFPSPRVGKRFVGESFEADDSRNSEHLNFIQ